ncbi:hypothetical protein POJ06DRAFT_243581 [Lipomyces tetrasporus]|uniref:Zn(2)-C6 fungal-type domain-containing protein n=1 Tax=Lipomyces tetrasporus TaxID=54092 RepID=A0AAD7QZQ7_9ASCO|nr:uncharacterized protein POJ06DRAFT_243581 [Lipomyces tetrasporus]KAJ8104103.1 hypothetical protein POJ06DRAFT_243581 [Lipomyces tetrasporus]
MASVPSLSFSRHHFSPFSTAPPHQILAKAYHHQPSSPAMTVPPGPAQIATPQAQTSTVSDPIVPRKRSKVSRACDECRRKKIRCDATADGVPEQCSSCKRVGEKCSFSRIPMKRGPSKGYIKELEDRLNSLESSFSTGDVSTPRRDSATSEARTSNDLTATITSGHKTSISSTGSNNYPADSPNSQYSSSYTFGYQAAGSPRTVIPEQPRQRTDSIHSLPPPQQSQNSQQALLNSPTLNPSGPGRRKRAFSSTTEYSNELGRPIPPLKTPFSNTTTERLPSIDSFRFGSGSQLPPLQGPTGAGASVVDEPAPPYMAPPNGPNHYWKPPYETGVSRPLGGSTNENASPRASIQIGVPPLSSSLHVPAPSVRSLQRHSIGSGMMGSYGPSTGDHRAGTDSLFPFTWDEEAVDAYYRYIHPTFPILAQSRSRLRYRLVATTSPIRNSCLHALYALIRGMVSAQRGEQDLQRAIQHLNDAQRDTAKLPLASSLVIIQTMVLLALETVNHGAAALDDGLRSLSHWLGAAIGMANSLRLHAAPSSLSAPSSSPPPDDSDLDSDVRLGRRIYLVIGMIDRWHAMSLSLPLQVPDHTMHLVSDDHVSLTTAPYHLVRLSLVLGHVLEASAFTDDSTPGSRHHMATVLRGELERVRESIEDVWDAKPELEIVYWHIKLAILRLLHVPDPQVLLGPATRMVGFLVQRMQNARATPSSVSPSNPAAIGSAAAPTLMSPLDHHFFALVVTTLLDLTEVHDARDDAWRSLNMVLDALPYSLEPAKWEACVRRAIETRKRASAGGTTSNTGSSSGLERLAAIAVGEATGAGGGPMVAETVKLRRLGYLGYLAL